KSIGPVIVKRDDGNLEWKRMRWGLPGAPSTGGAHVTNIRNLASPHWRGVLAPENRYIVTFTALSEYENSSHKRKKVIRWFAPPDRGMMAFAGVWRTWRGDYGSKKEPNVGEHLLFSFLTTAPNDVVRPVHAKAMPVILSTEAQYEEWLTAPANTVEAIQARVLDNSALEVLGDDEAADYAGGYIK